ncbi:hypothetical protein ABB37_04358 [Leptomonas pyrrhocoris]|uniref:Uncharacterized protein n=1 Tax=Leptomonas pyrrhocoris TaxID=157538 RepID=A0A0M9G2A7_LEPPY|nr:hypothetical protein ABB37_04358 [Leptomonas pyrrhocoris]KPA80970.1 hypothetical protein ABB37_04358 [Leptomonas pyrrhocoris]|eukprot:XP_015659409.1 hypothetical protein ABB37_04358 [Leptomonas pyrrhocoris]
MFSETYFSVRVKGCAGAAYEIHESRSCVMDLTSVLLEAQDNVRQIHTLNHVLGIHSAVPKPPAGPAPASPRPSIPTGDTKKGNDADSNKNADNMNESRVPDMYRMDTIVHSLSRPDVEADFATAPINLSATASSRTFTSVSSMQRLAHAVRDDLPMDVVATNALDFVAAWRKEDGRCTAQDDLFHECISSRLTIEATEEECRRRLRHLLFNVAEQLDRFAVLGEYDKFVVFCMENEPVWRQAARQLQEDNTARLNTAANIYIRFLLEDAAVSEKTKMYQEAADFVVSLSLMEREQRGVAQTKAVARRRRQSASQVTTPTATVTRRRNGDEAGASAGRAGSHSPNDPKAHKKEAGSGATAAERVKPLSSVEVDNYREGWRAILGHLTNGERGGPTHQNVTPPATALPVAAAAPLSAREQQHKNKSPILPEVASLNGSRNEGRQQQTKSKDFVFPSPKETKVETKRSPPNDKDKHKSLPPVSRDAQKIQKDDKAAVSSSSRPAQKSRDEPRGKRNPSPPRGPSLPSTRGAEAAARKSEADAKPKEIRPVVVNATVQRHADGNRDPRGGPRHSHREAKARS